MEVESVITLDEDENYALDCGVYIVPEYLHKEFLHGQHEKIGNRGL